MRLDGESLRSAVGSAYRRYWTCRYVTSASLRPMPSHAGEAADFRPKRNGNALRANRPFTETFSTAGGCILQRRTVRGSTNFSATVGNGLPALTPAIPDTN